jgi:hypothetical protein
MRLGYCIYYPKDIAYRWAGHVARMGRGEEEGVWVIGGKARGKKATRPLGRQRHRWLDNTGMDLVEVGWGDVD